MLVPSVSLADLSQLPSQVFLPSSPHWLLDAPNYVLLALPIMPPPLYWLGCIVSIHSSSVDLLPGPQTRVCLNMSLSPSCSLTPQPHRNMSFIQVGFFPFSIKTPRMDSLHSPVLPVTQAWNSTVLTKDPKGQILCDSTSVQSDSTETEGRAVVARGWGRREWGVSVSGRQCLCLGRWKSSGDGATTLWQ